MIDLRRALLLLLLATAGCDAGPTSDWPRPGDAPGPGDDDDEPTGPPTMAADASVGGNIDASVPLRDAGLAEACEAGDAGCLSPDF